MYKEKRSVIVAVASIVMTLAVMTVTREQQAATNDRAADEAAIRRIVKAVEDGWNAGDGKAFAAPFAEDADYVIVNGMRIKGRDTIASGHQQILDTIYKGSHNTATVLSIRFLRDDAAIAHVEWHLKYAENGIAHERKAMCSMVMTKQGGRWSIVAFHNTPITSTGR
ncbi:MAG TPA: SgcJ/EcaC family oxidoreductase [Blastocatellia bacterium]|nr:SgcJ/EcaC family oxidoreductase [Blastocatellia bacterium]